VDFVTSLYLQKWPLTSSTSVGRSIGIVGSLTQAMEFVLLFVWLPRVQSTLSSESSAISHGIFHLILEISRNDFLKGH
jgi:formate hydrogenlyase subunit 3/multisubunit Na+/H+ antiporter MnhD subunit